MQHKSAAVIKLSGEGASVELSDMSKGKTWSISHLDNYLSVNFSPVNKNKRTILNISDDAPANVFVVEKDGSVVVSRSSSHKLQKPQLKIRKAAGQPGNEQIVSNGDDIGSIVFEAHDGNDFVSVAAIEGQ